MNRLIWIGWAAAALMWAMLAVAIVQDLTDEPVDPTPSDPLGVYGTLCERIIELELTETEQAAFQKSVDAVKSLVATMAKLVEQQA